MKKILIILLWLCSIATSAQKDTVVVADYTLVMVGTDKDGELYPITTLDGVGRAGFFINGRPNGQIRFCLPDELFIWVNGRLHDVIRECRYYEPQQLFETADSDTIFVSMSTDQSLADLRCELVVFEDLLVIKDQVSEPRSTRNEFQEFTIIALIIILLLLGYVATAYPSRMTYIFNRAFTLKISAYEFVNTGFFSGASMHVLSFYSLTLGFSGVYLDGLLSAELFGLSETISDYLWTWLQVSAGVFLLFVAKWVVVSLVSGLFKFRGLKDYQLFDFLNFNLLLSLPILLFLVIDFIANNPSVTWLSPGFMALYPVVLILFVMWFTFKFVNNSPRRKLMIISYLCATEIIPVLALLGWFFK